MHAARRMAEMPPRVRWQVARLVTRSLYRGSFGSLDDGTVIVRPHRLQGGEHLHFDPVTVGARARPVGA